MSEYNLRGWFVAALRPLDAVAVENPACPGTPDVNCVLGWIELKHVPAAPARAGTPVRVDHYTQQQRLWARRRAAAGGMCLMYLQVGNEHFLLDGVTAAFNIGEATMGDLKGLALKTWTGNPKPEDLLEAVIHAQIDWSRSFLRRVRDFACSADGRTGA